MLTGCGLEVEGQEVVQSIKGGLKGVVIGEVLTCEKHPNSDHLSITTVDVGSEKILHIVCGANNVARGQKVAVATIGTTLYFGDKELTLQRTKIRGEVSEGMICAEDELGIGASHDGIMVLDADAAVGMAASDYFKVEEDNIFTIGLTPNRVDAASHVGVARDLVAVANSFGRDEPPTTDNSQIVLPNVSSFKVDHDNRHVEVIIEDAEACPRYSGITISGISVGESPDWLKHRLTGIGLRPINNIVDVTNFVLMEVGQPLHAFDCNQIDGNRVVVKKHPRGTKFVTLDHVERELSENDLMICNAQEPMCIAGVFGGAKSGVTTSTTSVFIESAYFDPAHIRKSSRFHGLQTDASFRFERGADIDITVYALKRAAMMIKEIAGGEISSEIVDVFPAKVAPRVVHFSFKRLNNLIGKSLNHDVVKRILTDLGIVSIEENRLDQSVVLEIPAYKVDVTREADVVEEILRVYGYNNIELPDEIRTSISYTLKPDPEKVQNLVSDYLTSNGFFEIICNSLTRSHYYEENQDYPVMNAVKILNPISRDLDVMRQTLLYGALESVVYNQNRKISDLKLFEFGRVYSAGSFDNEPLRGYHEEKHLALIITGRLQPENWKSADAPVDFYNLTGYVEGFFKRLAISPDLWQITPVQSVVFGNGMQYEHKGKVVLTLGSLSNHVLKIFDIRQPVYFAEINWDYLFSLIAANSIQFKGIPKFPEVRRDLALLVDKQVTFAEIEKVAFQTEKKLLKKVGLFDVYEGENIAAGKKSYAINLVLQSEDKTLTDNEIEKVVEKILRAMVTNFNAMLR